MAFKSLIIANYYRIRGGLALDIKSISIFELKVGMFVTEFTDEKKRISVKKPGKVPSLKLIEKLKSDGILSLMVDFERSTFDTNIAPETWARDKSKILSLNQEINRANKLLTESKLTVSKMLETLFIDKTVDVTTVEQVADEIVDSLSNNSDALHSLSALRTKDAYLLEHSLNVGVLLASFGRYLGWPKERLAKLIVGGIVHDIGKTQVELAILNKPDRLTEAEFEHMKLHQVYSVELLNNIDNLHIDSREVSTMHHEKLDGAGYPLGLKGAQISEIGRMSSIVDIYDALTANRCYKKAMSPAKAFKIMNGLAGFHLDGELLKAFMLCMGIYPVGSLVELSNNLLGLVWESNENDMQKPIVKVFYNTQYKKYYDVKIINLAQDKLSIKRAVSPSEFDMDIDSYRYNSVA